MLEPVKTPALGRVSVSSGTVRQARSAGEQPVSSPVATDTPIRVADVSSLIAMARSVANEGPPVNQALVEQLRAALADGSYRIDPGKIAKAMNAFFSRP